MGTGKIRIMSKKIEPALTPEEWAAGRAELLEGGDGVQDVIVLDSGPDRIEWVGLPARTLSDGRVMLRTSFPDDLAIVIALANAALPDGDPRKITRANVVDLGDAATQIEEEGGGGHVWRAEHVARLRQFADALDSYLPRENAGEFIDRKLRDGATDTRTNGPCVCGHAVTQHTSDGLWPCTVGNCGCIGWCMPPNGEPLVVIAEQLIGPYGSPAWPLNVSDERRARMRMQVFADGQWIDFSANDPAIRTEAFARDAHHVRWVTGHAPAP